MEGGRQSGGRNLSPWCSLLEGWLDVGQEGPTSQPGRAGAGVVLPDSLSCSSSFQNPGLCWTAWKGQVLSNYNSMC